VQVPRRRTDAPVAEFFHHDRVVEKAAARAAVFGRDAGAEDADLARAPPDGARRDAGFLPFRVFRRHFVPKKLAHRAAKRLVLGLVERAGNREVHGGFDSRTVLYSGASFGHDLRATP